MSDIRAKPINNLTSDRQWKDVVTRACICGCTTFYAVVCLDENNEIGGYFTEGICFDCNAWVTLATPLDLPASAE